MKQANYIPNKNRFLKKRVVVNNRKQTIFLSIILFTIIILFLGIPYTKWGFKTDDFGNIYHCFIKTYKDVLRFFYEGSIEVLSHPSNSAKEQGFFCGLYRPMSFIYYLPQVYFFKTNAYGYFFITIILHAINSVILFNIFLKIIPIIFAFLAAAYFAFHPSLHNWIGWISAQTYFSELLVLLILILFLKKYLNTKKIKYYLISCFLLVANLFLKEATVIFALWSIPATYFYKKITKNNQISSWENIKNSILISIPYWIITAFYLTVRAIVLPITSNTGTLNFKFNWPSFIARMKDRFFDFVSYISDILGLNWIPPQTQIFKGILIILLISFLIFLFIKNKKKSYILFLIFSVLIFSWPALLIQYQPRYIYMSLTFFILMIIISFKFFKQIKIFYKFKNVIIIILISLITFNTIFLMKELKKREKIRAHITTSFNELIKNNTLLDAINNKTSLYFFNLPKQFSEGTAQALWMLTKNSTYNVYQYGKPNNKNEKILSITWDYKLSKFKILKN